MISHEKRTFQRIQKGSFTDIYIRIMNKYTGLHIAPGVNMEIPSAACDTSSHVFRIVLKIHRENRLRISKLTNSVVHLCTLIRSWQKFRRRIVSHRHIMEEPDK